MVSVPALYTEVQGKMRKFNFEVLGLGMNNNDYPGAFTKPVQDIINSLISSPCLHLYSGSSLIGDCRIDIEHQNATDNLDVDQFVKTDNQDWVWVILDPPYQITRTDAKLNGYGIKGAVSSCVQRRRPLKQYLQQHAFNILWLDQCAPMIEGFKREKLWLLLPGGYHNVRVLSWLKREMKPLL